MIINVGLVAAGPRGFGKTTVLNICKEALEAKGYTVGDKNFGPDTESFYVTLQAKRLKEERIEWHRQEIARLAAELGII